MTNLPSISPFIIKKLKSTSWGNRTYIHDLLKLRKWIKMGCDDINENYNYSQLVDRYPLEYRELLIELNLSLKVA